MAFTEAEAESAGTQEMVLRREAGLPIEIVHGNRAREIEPALSTHVRLAAVSMEDGYAASNLVGGVLRAALTEAGVEIRDGAAVTAIERSEAGFHRAPRRQNVAIARQLLVTSECVGAGYADLVGHAAPADQGPGQPGDRDGTDAAHSALGGSSGQPDFAEADIQWHRSSSVVAPVCLGIKTPDDIDGLLSPETIVQKLQIAGYTIPELAGGRMVRTWHGIEGYSGADNQPLIGSVPNVPGAFVMACLRSGFTTGPFVGRLMAEKLLGTASETELFLPEFAPSRLVGMEFAA